MDHSDYNFSAMGISTMDTRTLFQQNTAPQDPIRTVNLREIIPRIADRMKRRQILIEEFYFGDSKDSTSEEMKALFEKAIFPADEVGECRRVILVSKDMNFLDCIDLREVRLQLFRVSSSIP
jgi:hypothetical protein